MINYNLERDSSVGIAAGYSLNGQIVEVRFEARDRKFSLLHSVQTLSGVHSASYLMDTKGKATGA
jgi:hypothetical protein